MTTEVEIIGDGWHEGGSDCALKGRVRVVTFRLEYPRYIHSQLKTHRVFSSCSASSRAIPLDRMIEQVENNPAIPLWTMNQPGMQGQRADMETTSYACGEWMDAMKDAIYHVRELQSLGIHKQDANRLLEPFMHIRTILTGTAEGLEHFFRLRIDEAAQPEINLLATKMRDAMEKSVPVNVPEGAWMTPYYGVTKDPETILKAVARCAQVSYRKDADDMETVQRVITRLVSGHALHASPFEHVWRPSPVARCPGNLSYCRQLRHVVEDWLQEKSYAGVLKVLEMFVR